MFSGSVKVSNSVQEQIFPDVTNVAGNTWLVESLINQARRAGEWVDSQTDDDKCTFYMYFSDDTGVKSISVTVKYGYQVLHALSSFLDNQFYRIRMILKIYGELILPMPTKLKGSVRQYTNIDEIVSVLFAEARKWETFDDLEDKINSAIRLREESYKTFKKSSKD